MVHGRRRVLVLQWRYRLSRRRLHLGFGSRCALCETRLSLHGVDACFLRAGQIHSRLGRREVSRTNTSERVLLWRRGRLAANTHGRVSIKIHNSVDRLYSPCQFQCCGHTHHGLAEKACPPIAPLSTVMRGMARDCLYPVMMHLRPERTFLPFSMRRYPSDRHDHFQHAAQTRVITRHLGGTMQGPCGKFKTHETMDLYYQVDPAENGLI